MRGGSEVLTSDLYLGRRCSMSSNGSIGGQSGPSQRLADRTFFSNQTKGRSRRVPEHAVKHDSQQTAFAIESVTDTAGGALRRRLLNASDLRVGGRSAGGS